MQHRRRRPTATAAWCALLLRPALAQNINIDWSTIEVDAAGEVTFGPRLDIPPEDGDAPALELMAGYFANSDGFYGRPHFEEIVLVHMSAEGGRLQAVKVVGDANVPRGQLTFRSERFLDSAPRWSFPIQLRLRDDVTANDGYWWSPSHRHEVEFEPDYSAFYIAGANPASSGRAYFYRLPAEQAVEAARMMKDAA